MRYYRPRYTPRPAPAAWEADRVNAVKKRLQALRDGGRLTPKFAEVVESFENYITEKSCLTPGQENFLVNIERQCLPNEQWETSFTADMRELAVLAARYYKTTAYFQHLADKILNDESYVPTEEEYKKIVLNKYAQKAIKAYREPSKWNKGEQAVFRQTLNMNALPRELSTGKLVRDLRNTKVLIVDTVVRPGLYKVVKVMCMAAPQLGVIEIEERWLKNAPKVKK